jgi:uncharacterized membrane protein
MNAAAAGTSATGGAGAATLSSGSTCPPRSTLTYDNFGKPFFAKYCLSCHTVTVTGSARQAPPDRNFDDAASIRTYTKQIDQQAAAGPAGTHGVMPPLDPKPIVAERTMLGEWLACGAR